MKEKKILILSLLVLFILGCSKKDMTTIGQEGEYIANFDFPTYKVSAPAKVILTNRSKNADRFLWEYSGGQTLNNKGEILDDTSSQKITPDTLFYALPGTYKVKLTTWQGDGNKKEVSKTIVIEKQQPQIIVPENIGVFTEVTFSAKVFQYPGGTVTYSWDLGEAGTSTLAEPKATFTTEGPHLVKLTINDGQETLSTEVTIDVKGELAKTLYFTDATTRRIYRYKLRTMSASSVEWIGVTTGYNAFGLSVRGNKLYLSETGHGTRFSSAPFTVADGVLKSFNLDGTGENIITKPVATTLDYRDDPWMHTVDKNGNIWWTTRNYGLRVVNASATEIAYPAYNANLNINATIAGEAVTTYFSSDVKEVGNEIWVSYAGTTGKGIYKYSNGGTYLSKFTTAIQSHAIRTFVVDSVNKHIYFAINRDDAGRTVGLYRSDIDGSNIVAVDIANDMKIAVGAYSNQGAAGEFIYITNIDIDVDESGNGYLYYGYRSNTDISGSGNPATISTTAPNSGIKRVKLKGGYVPEFLFKGYAPYGLAIDQVKR